MLPRALPRLGDILFVSILAGALLIGQRMLNVDSDLGRHLVLGRHILQSGTVPSDDILSFTLAGHSRPPYEWLAQAAFAATHAVLGLDGPVLLTAVLIASAYSLTFCDAVSRSKLPLVSLGCVVWAAWAGSVHWLTRPHVFTLAIFPLWIMLLQRLSHGHRDAMWQLPMLMLLWANTHAGFILGFIAWSAYMAGCAWERIRSAGSPEVTSPLLLAGIFSALASLLTPDLWNNWLAVFRNNSAYVLARTAETQPPGIAAHAYWPFFALLVATGVLALMARRSLDPSHLLLLFALGAFSLAFARNLPLFGLAAAPILASWASTMLPRESRFTRLEGRLLVIEAGRRGSAWPPLAVAAAALMLVSFGARFGERVYSYEPANFPVRAANWLEQNPQPGRMFNDLNWGGYLLYRLWPAQRVFIDSQSDFYGEVLIREYEAILAAVSDWDLRLSEYEIGWVIVRSDSPLAAVLTKSPDWQVAFDDSTAVILVRSNR